MKNEKLGKKNLDYKWVIVVLSFMMVCISLGFCSSPVSLFLGPVSEALNVSRSVFALDKSIRFIITAIVNLFFGALIAKFGPKKLIIAGMTCLIGAMLVYSFAKVVYVYYIGGALLGLGFSWTSTTMVGYVINKWCKENKGTIMGAVLASNGLGGAIAMQMITPMIESSPLGYKNAYFVVACILVVVITLLIIFFKDKPKGTVETGEKVVHKKKARGESWVGIEFSDALRKWWFYGALACIFLTGFVLQGISGIAAAHMKDTGIDPTYVATVLSAHSIALAGFKFLTGFIYDKCGLRITVNICAVTAVLIRICLSLVSPTPLGMVLAMVYGIFSSLALPLETILLPIYANDLFGEKSYSKILGIVVSFNVAGYAVGAPVVNIFYDLTKSYNIGLYICAIVMFAVIICLQFVISAAKKERKAIIDKLAEQENLVENCEQSA